MLAARPTRLHTFYLSPDIGELFWGSFPVLSLNLGLGDLDKVNPLNSKDDVLVDRLLVSAHQI